MVLYFHQKIRSPTCCTGLVRYTAVHILFEAVCTGKALVAQVPRTHTDGRQDQYQVDLTAYSTLWLTDTAAYARDEEDYEAPNLV